MHEFERTRDSQIIEADVLKSASAARDNRDLTMRFESLGGTGHGCEFGLFQRHFGAEPLGLLRWADLDHHLLIGALESRFDGVGLTENTLVFNPDGSDEWWTRDTRYWMAMRSFVKTADVGLDRMTVQVCRRLEFLRRKLIEDLELGEKIFVYKNIFRNLTDLEVARMQAAVRSYGDSTLFYVRYADNAHPAGTVEAKEAGLLIGYIDHFVFSPDNKQIGPANDAWFSLCDRAYRMHLSVPVVANAGAEEPAARRIARPARPRRVVLIGNCQMQAMTDVFNRFVAGRTGDILEHIASYEDLTPERRAAIEQADVVVEQLFDLSPRVDTDGIAKNTPRLFIPLVTGAFLWPFSGPAHPKNQTYPFLTGGPYGGDGGDSYLNRLILAGIDSEEAIETYANLDIKSRVNLDRLYELVMDRQRSRDEAAGYNIADVIEQHFRTEQIFLSPYHPNVRVAVALATEFFKQLGAEPAEIERMQTCTIVTPFPKGELPLHPSVCRHFGMDFVAPGRRYRFMNEGSFTFREYVSRYMRYEWNEALEEGMSLVHAGDLDPARDRLVVGLERSPRSAAGHNALSHIMSKRGTPAEAIASARLAVALEPDSASYRGSLGNLLRQSGHLEEADAELQNAVAANLGEPHYLVLLAHLRQQRGAVADAIGLIRQAIGLDPYSQKLQAALATMLATPENLDTAIAAARQAIVLAPDDAASYDRLAEMLARQNRIDEAVAAAQTAVKLDPVAGRFHIALSKLLLLQNQQPEALIEAYVAALSEPGSAAVYDHLGCVLRATGDHRAAELAFRRASELAPMNAHLRHELSVALSQLQRLDEAVATAKEAADLEPDNPHRAVYLAKLCVQANDLPGARAAQIRAVDLEPETIVFRIVLSDLFARQGLMADALAEANKAVAGDPGSTHALGHLAHVTQLTGDFAGAEVFFRKAIEMRPDNADLRRQLEFLERRKHQVHAA